MEQAESAKNEWMAHIKESDTILHSMNACFMLVDRDFVVLRTNYYDLNGIPGEPVSNRVGDLLKCKNAVRVKGAERIIIVEVVWFVIPLKMRFAIKKVLVNWRHPCGCSVRTISILFLVMYLFPELI